LEPLKAFGEIFDAHFARPARNVYTQPTNGLPCGGGIVASIPNAL